MKRNTYLLLVACLLLSCSPLRNYRSTEEVVKWEEDIRTIESRFSDIETSEKILLTGSSSIRRWDSADSDLMPYKVIRKAYGGAKLSDYAFYADRIFDNRKYKGVVFFVANDITGAESDKTPEEVMRLFRCTYRTFRKSNPGTPFFWVSITPTPSRWKVWEEIKRVNEMAMEFCDGETNAWFIDTTTHFLDSNNEPRAELFTDDRLHLNADGYRLWSQLILDALNSVYK